MHPSSAAPRAQKSKTKIRINPHNNHFFLMVQDHCKSFMPERLKGVPPLPPTGGTPTTPHKYTFPCEHPHSPPRSYSPHPLSLSAMRVLACWTRSSRLCLLLIFIRAMDTRPGPSAHLSFYTTVALNTAFQPSPASAFATKLSGHGLPACATE